MTFRSKTWRMPEFMRRPDLDWSRFSENEVRRLLELKPMRWDRADKEPVRLNFGYDERPLTVDVALGYFERRADEELR